MNTITLAGVEALSMVGRLDPTLVEIVALSLRVSLASVALSAALALPIGALVAVAAFPGRRAAVVVLNALRLLTFRADAQGGGA